MEIITFYSWQSDTDRKIGRNFIQNCIEDSIDKVNKQLKSNQKGLNHVKNLILDQATERTLGSVDIANSLFDKIDLCNIFICDISIVQNSRKRKHPNPNVLIELGYAASRIGWENVIMIFNTSKCKVEKLPFDIRSRRVFDYKLSSSTSPEIKTQEKKRLKERITAALYDQALAANSIKNDPIIRILPYVWNRISDLLDKWQLLISQLYSFLNENKPDDYNYEIIDQICSRIDPYSKPKGLHASQHNNWYEYTAYLSQMTNKKIGEIFVFQDKIDLEIIDLLAKAENEVSNNNLYDINRMRLGNNEMSHLSGSYVNVNFYLKAAIDRFSEIYREHNEEYHKQFKEQRKRITKIKPAHTNT